MNQIEMLGNLLSEMFLPFCIGTNPGIKAFLYLVLHDIIEFSCESVNVDAVWSDTGRIYTFLEPINTEIKDVAIGQL